jgi:hypothetical protein
MRGRVVGLAAAAAVAATAAATETATAATHAATAATKTATAAAHHLHGADRDHDPNVSPNPRRSQGMQTLTFG